MVVDDHPRRGRTKRPCYTHPQSPLQSVTDLSSSSKQHHRHHHHCSRKRKRSQNQFPPALPLNSHPLVKEDFEEYKQTFRLYLDIQKGKNLDNLDQREVKGRWKSFMRKWNCGELSEGWYDPLTKLKASENFITNTSRIIDEDGSRSATCRQSGMRSCSEPETIDGSDSDQSVGPMLPGQEMRSRTRRLGPTIPSTQDLQVIGENQAEDRIARFKEHKFARKADQKQQKEALDEIIPRAMSGTRERQLEKKKELNDKMKSFREKSPGAAADIPDADLMGDRDDLELYKIAKQEMERKKNERELRKEALLRIRVAEREERLRKYRAKEEATIGMFKALAKQRFG